MLSAGNSFATPTLNALASRWGTVQTQGETMGAMSSAGSLGRFFGAMTVGLAMYFAGEAAQFQYAFWVSAGIMALAALLAMRIRQPQVSAS